VTLQITAAPDSSNIPTFLSAGFYGPAMPGEAMPPGSDSPLFTVSPPMPTMASSTWSMTTKLRPQNLANILEYLRTGRAFFSVSTDRIPEGELRGQMEVPMCYEAAMAPTSELPASWEVMNPYAFANVIVSRGGGDVAVFLQMPTDNGRKLSSGVTKVFARDGAGASILEIQPSAWDSCVRGTFDGRSVSGTACSDEQRHTYKAEVNNEGASAPVFHVVHHADASLAQRLTNSSTVLGVETVNSRNDPGMTFEVEGGITAAVPCRRLMTAADSLYSMAKEYRSDWVTLWSLNVGNPDFRRTLVPRYFAHPLQILRGETSYAIQRRYGMSEGEILKVNPAIRDIGSLPVGSHVCVVPNWQTVVAGNGQKVCSA